MSHSSQLEQPITVSRVCRRLRMSRQNFYWEKKKRSRRRVEAELLAQFTRDQRREHARMGCRKILYLFGQAHTQHRSRIGRDRAFEELRKRGLLVPKKKAKPRTTRFNQNLPSFKNQIRDLEVASANQVWVSDLTYIQTAQGHLYLSLVSDKFSRKIQGYHAAEDLKTGGCLRALERALKGLPKGQYPIHHSDRGCQYASHEYIQRLKSRGLKISMTDSDHCAENALAERINGILKQEYELDAPFRTKEQAREAIKQAIYLYNEKRPHSALGYMTPSQKNQESLVATLNSWRPATLRLAGLASTTPDARN